MLGANKKLQGTRAAPARRHCLRHITAKEAKQTEGAEGADDLRLAFDLRLARRQFEDYRPIDTSRMVNHTFVDTTFSQLEQLAGRG